MSLIPWGAILTHGPALVSAARSLLASQSTKANERNRSIEARLDQLEKASIESARLLEELAEQLQALTLAPIDRRLIDVRLMTDDEISWLDAYHMRVRNTLPEMTAIHWHGILLPANMDGVPGLSFHGIEPGGDHLYRFKVRQSGTYWYHSHSSLQEQAGPDHAPRFVVQVKVKGFDPVMGEGGSKRQAEQDAAAKLLAIVTPQELIKP